MKIFNQCYRVTCRDNLIIDLQNSNGIWYDVGNIDGVFINNWVEGVGNVYEEYYEGRRYWSGFFFEISKGAICAGNVFVNCENGIFVLNSSDVKIYQNTLVNSVGRIRRTARNAVSDHFGWHPSTGPDVEERDGHIFVNNLLTADDNFKDPLLFVLQPDSLRERLNKQQLKILDHNVYVRQSEKDTNSLILWSPVKNDTCYLGFESPEDLHKLHSNFSANSKYFAKYKGPLFKSAEQKNYQLLQGFPGADAGRVLPDEISKLLNLPTKNIRYIGAYPVKEE
ncbi:hypothetical protein ES708_33488 [subsurface metagenome]